MRRRILRVSRLEDRTVPTVGDLLVTGAGATGGPHVKVFDAETGAFKFQFLAYDPVFAGGVRVATADVTGDGAPDIITGPGPGGGPDIRVFDGISRQLVREFLAYDDVLSLKLEEGALVVQTGRPDAFYTRLTELAASGEHGAINEVTSPDNNLQAVFQYLVKS